jgi:hypothetical protein
MIHNISEPTEAKPRSGDTDGLLAQAQALAARVENLPEGPRKKALKAALADVQSLLAENERDARKMVDAPSTL